MRKCNRTPICHTKVGNTTLTYSSQMKTSCIVYERRAKNHLGHPPCPEAEESRGHSGVSLWNDCLVRRRSSNRRWTGHRKTSPRVGIEKRTQGEVEAAVCEGVSRFKQDYMGRGPKDIRAHLLGDLLVVRLHGVLTAAEQHLAKSPAGEEGRDLLKQMQAHLIETARPALEAMVREVTGVKVLSMHHDISTATGEEVVLFTLAESPMVRDLKKE